MKKLFFLVLILSITSESFAQYQPNSESIFEVPASKIKRSFLIELGRSDKMQIELTDIKDLANIRNVDSIVALFLRDIRPLKDSLTEGIFSRRIDYIVDTTSQKKIRMQKFTTASSHFAVIDGSVSLLKLEQDTITIIGKVRTQIKAGIFGYYTDYAYYRISFFLNNLNDLATYVDGKMNDKVKSLEENVNSLWINRETSGVYLRKDPDISAPNFRGFLQAGRSFSLRLAVNIQNYKNYFVPSASYGFVFIKSNSQVRHKFGMQYENHFQFSKNDSGRLNTYRNDFLTLIYERENILTGNLNGVTKLSPTLSFGYFIRKSGDFYEKNTFKLGLGRYAPFGGNLRFEPTFYFNDFFKGITPSLRITQYF